MNVLTRILLKPEELEGLDERQVFDLMVQAHAESLLGRVWYLSQQHGIALPNYAEWHFSSAFKRAARQQSQALHELKELCGLLDWLGVNWILLKGAAYIALDLPVAQGRTFADLDILVPREQLPLVERHLHMRHWLRTEMDDYDDKYYRQWMHEIPPLRHRQRGTILDLHHNILPLTNPDAPDITRFAVQTRSHPYLGTIRTLSDTDLFIHTAVHLFAESEYSNSMRDLLDIDMLLRHFQGQDPAFIAHLRERADLHGLTRYTELALGQCAAILQRPIPPRADAGPPGIRDKLLAAAYRRIFTPAHSSTRLPGHDFAAFILYCRGHLLKMPLRLLIPHLLRKLITRSATRFKARDLPKEVL